MDINKTQTNSAAQPLVDEGLRDHMNRVYGTMSAGLIATFTTAWTVANTPLIALFFNPETGGPNLLGWIAIFAPLVMIFGFLGFVSRGSAVAVRTFFYAFSAVIGVSMSSIFMIYAGSSIAQVFLLTSAAFAGLSLWGYTTGKDLSGWGSFLLMGLIGLIGAMIVNIFIGSSAFDFAINVIGVGIFAGLTAYDTQKIKSDYIVGRRSADSEWVQKAATLGALSLYLNFINMFQMLLSLLGDRD